MKLIDFIKKTLKEKGIDEKHADRILKAFKLEKEEDVAGAVDLFKDNLLPAITEAETKAQKDAEEATRKAAIEAYEKEHGLKGGKPVDPSTPPIVDPTKIEGLSPELKALIEGMSKQITDLGESVKGYQKSTANSAKAATAKALISNAKLPDNWLSRVNLESETTLEDQIKALETEYIDIQQKAIDDKVASGEYTPGSVQMKDRSEAEWTSLMNSDVTPNNSGTVDLGLSK